MTGVVGIETDFEGVTYRSRLEARWACTLMLLGIHFEYEPLDLNGYLPDFLADVPVYGGQGVGRRTPTLIEVKPAWLPEDYCEPVCKIARSGWTGQAVVLGATVRETTLFGHQEHWFGYGHPEVRDRHAEDGSREWFQVGWDADNQAFALGARGDLVAVWREAGRRVRYMPNR